MLRISGPDHWHIDYPHCGGVRQSPIDIATADVVVDSAHLTPIVFSGYDQVSNTNFTLNNNGHTGTAASATMNVGYSQNDNEYRGAIDTLSTNIVSFKYDNSSSFTRITLLKP